MKKLILTSTAFVALAAAAYAQVIQQVGQQQFAQHNQFGQNQTGTISQVQSSNDPNLTNYGNYAITFQGTPSNTGANTLTIEQNGGSQGNRAGIGQSGGPGNTATIQQNGGPGGLSGGATSTSATIGAAGEDGNFAGISQIGANNVAQILENNNSRRNAAETYQNGTNNIAQTFQSNGSVSNKAYIFQGFSGPNSAANAVNGNQARITQGRGNINETNPTGGISEAIGSMAMITQTASTASAQINQGGQLNSVGPTAGRVVNVDARINQSAVNTNATVFQGNAGGEAIGSKAAINQTTVNQIATISQASNQSGQIGGSDYNSTATINQTGTTGGQTGSRAEVNQAQGGATDSDQATINQTGAVANSQGVIFQGFNAGSYSSNDVATINQSGNTTTATINQNVANGAGNESNGSNNTATITQGAGVVGVFSGAIGTGSGLARIFQGYSLNAGGGTVQANRNAATIQQTAGAGLRASIIQGASAVTPLTDAARASIALTGLNGTVVALSGTVTNDNTASIDQTSGDNHNANIFQTGRFNTATVAQSNGNGHRALIVQTVNSQRAIASISQTSTGTGNVATILQFAGSNADGVGQYGNMASISQVAGSNNVAFIQQGIQGAATSSNDNMATIVQNGSNNFARFLQVGNNNLVDITQNGNNNQVLNAAGDPGSYGSQQGYNNRLTLVQNGGNVGVTYRYTQIGNNNTQVVNQNVNP